MHNKLHNRNILYSIRMREYMTKSTFRLGFKIVRTVVCQKDMQFQKVWEKHSNQPIMYEGGLLFFSNYTKCCVCFGPGGIPCQLYSFAERPATERVEDCLVSYGPLDKIPMEKMGYRPSLLALSSSWLRRYDLETGVLLEQVYLSPSYKFKHLAWDTDMQYFVAHTILMDNHDRPQQESKTLMVLAVFGIFPLRFVAMLKISTDVFGRDICSCLMSDGLILVVMHRNHSMRCYSFEDILKQGKRHDASLYKYCEELGGVVGTPPCGLPINITLTACPDVMFEVRSAGRYLCIGGIPWHYIMMPQGQEGSYQVFPLADKQLIQSGTIDRKKLTLEPDNVNFHNDGRIMHTSSHEIRMLRLVESDANSDSRHRLKEDYVIKAPQSTTSVESQPKFSSSGRAIRRTARYSENALEDTPNTIQALDYEDELDLIVAVVTETKHGDIRVKVKLYDNETGRLMRDIELNEPTDEFDQHVIILDLDTIIHTVSQPGRKYSCYIHRLERTPTEPRPTRRKGATRTRQTTRPRRRTASRTASQ